MSRYNIEIITTDGGEETIECTNLKEVVSELMGLATRRDIECLECYDTQREGLFGYYARITEA